MQDFIDLTGIKLFHYNPGSHSNNLDKYMINK